ncbi:MAG: hypothetical protein ACLTJG_19155 [[Clostridium] innocuum]
MEGCAAALGLSGQSEFQLGYTVRLLPNGLTTEFDEKKESDKDKDAEEGGSEELG